MSRRMTSGQRWWYGQIESRAYARLSELRRPRPGGLAPLWDGEPPVPVEHVAEHLLGLAISYEAVEELDGEEILGCLRPETGEIVLNENHTDRFRDVPGTERHTIGHECGHADVFGEVAKATMPTLPGLAASHHTKKRSSLRGDVRVLRVQMNAAMRAQLGRCAPDVRAEVLRRWELRDRDEQRRQVAAGADTPLVRRAVDHYAATLLMPRDLVRRAAEGLDLTRWSSVDLLARQFVVSKQAMLIQLETLGLIHGVSPDRQILLHDPAEASQISLL
jgi:hypothetical protein